MYHLKGSPADPNRLYASQSSGWFGQVIQRSSDGGKTWEPVGNKFAYDGVPGTHLWYDGTPAPVGVRARLAPRAVADRSRTRSTPASRTPRCSARPTAARRGRSSPDCADTRPRRPGSRAPAGCACTRSCSIRAIPDGSSSPSRRPASSGATTPARRGGRSTAVCGPSRFPIRPPRSATACTASPCTARDPTCCSCRSTGTSCAATTPASPGARSAGTCRPTSDFRSTCTRTSRRPSTSCRSRATPSTIRPTASCASTAAAPAAHEWEALTNGLPQRDCYVNVLRDAMAVDSLDPCGVYFGTTGGQVYASADAGDSWAPIVRDLPSVVSVEVQTLP